MIVPIHKNGSKMNPDNYRGISLISCFAKSFFVPFLAKDPRKDNLVLFVGIEHRTHFSFCTTWLITIAIKTKDIFSAVWWTLVKPLIPFPDKRYLENWGRGYN